MHLSKKQFSKLVLVCTNERMDGRMCCAQKAPPEFYQALKVAVAGMDPTIRVSKTGCLGNCEGGAIVALMPKNVYLGGVEEKDIPEILEMLKD
jgi:(2Fe-2S) ferredoxin